MNEPENTRQGIPKGALLVQLKRRRKQPDAARGQSVVAVLASDFVPKTGQNIGIFLDGNFVAVDIDEPDHPNLAEWLDKLPDTWQQVTPKGRHLLYRVPVGFIGTNLDKSHIGFGDIKTKGYIVAPGSEVESAGPGHPAGRYVLTHDRDPAPAPAWLLARLRVDGPREALARGGAERDAILDGERDNALVALAGAMRRQGYSESAMAAMLGAIVESGVVEQPPGREVTDLDVARIAQSIARKPVGEFTPEIAFLPAQWETNEHVKQPEPLEWIMPGFIPAVGLTVLYGDGKIGKSSFASLIAANVTKKNKIAVFIGSGEETFEQFAYRANLSGALPGLIVSWPASVLFALPKSIAVLEESIKMLKTVAFVYIDALYAHFSDTPGLHAGERARANLQALALMAINQNISVLGTIHENKSGDILGSKEMRNVARSLIHATRKEHDDFVIRSKGSNGFASDFGVSFPGKAVPLFDHNNKPVVFTDLFGEVHPQVTWVLELGKKIGATESISVDDISLRPEQAILEYLLANPAASNSVISQALNIPLRTVQRYAQTCRQSVDL